MQCMRMRRYWNFNTLVTSVCCIFKFSERECGGVSFVDFEPAVDMLAELDDELRSHGGGFSEIYAVVVKCMIRERCRIT